MLATILALSGLAVRARGQDAAAHKPWMDDAADLQDELREQLLAKSGDKAAAAATRIEALLARTQRATTCTRKNARTRFGSV